MCCCPHIIPNPWYGEFNRELGFLHDCHNSKMYVPCGVCPQCLSVKQNYIMQRVLLLATDHFVFFGTLTYNNESLPVVEYDGQQYAYPDMRDFTLMMKRIRKDNLAPASFKYLVCSEYGGKRHRPHFHFLLFFKKNEKYISPEFELAHAREIESSMYKVIFDQWKRNYGGRKFPIWKPLFTFKKILRHGKEFKNFDFHYVEPFTKDGKTTSDVAAYVSKYVLKYDPWLKKRLQALYAKINDPDIYNELRNKLKSRVLFSKHFGDDPSYTKHVRKGIDYSINKTDEVGYIFINPVSGQHYPLSPYLKKKFLKIEDAVEFFKKRHPGADILTDYTLDSCPQESIKDKIAQQGIDPYEQCYRTRANVEKVLILRSNFDFYELE